MNQLSETEQKLLADQGFLPPYGSVWQEVDLDRIRRKLLVHMSNRADKHPLYGRYSTRDWHLVYPEITRLVSHPSILGQLKTVMGDSLLLWRSVVFYKPPGAGPIGWHQEFGSYSGEDIGNNKVSLIPSHLEHVNESLLSRYLDDSLKLQKSEPAPDQSDFWNMTVWIALSDVDIGMGPIQFVRGSHKVRYPIRMEPITQADFWQDPFADISSKSQLVDACSNSSLVLDVDTTRFLDGISIDGCSFAELKNHIMAQLDEVLGSTTVSDEVQGDKIASFPMKKGSYLIFSERTMHGSLANISDKPRLAINFRITPSTTLVYPSRLRGDFVDGFNLNIAAHKCILLCGENKNPDNSVEILRNDA